MPKVTIILLLLIPALLFGQATVRIINKKTNECYYVLKSDSSIREGSYKKWGWNDKSKIEGFYKNGVRDSIWTFYDYIGKVEQRYNYTTTALLYSNTKKTGTPKKIKILKGTDTVEAILDQYPVYIGGNTELSQFVTDKLRNLTYWNIGHVYVVVSIDKNGKATYSKIFGHSLIAAEEILKVLKSLPYDWVPGILNGEKVDIPNLLLPIYL